MTILEMVNSIRTKVKSTKVTALDDAGGHWTVQDILDKINEESKKIVSKTESLIGVYTTSTVASQSEYAYQSDWIRVLAVYYNDKPLEPLSIDEIDSAEAYQGLEEKWRTKTDSEPKAWMKSDTTGYFRIYPATSGSGTNDLKIAYIAQPTTITTASTPTDEPFSGKTELRPYHDLVVYRIVSDLIMEDASTEVDIARMTYWRDKGKELEKELNRHSKYPRHLLPVISACGKSKSGVVTPYWVSGTAPLS